MAKATLTHMRARRARHPSASSVSAASAVFVLTRPKSAEIRSTKRDARLVTATSRYLGSSTLN